MQGRQEADWSLLAHTLLYVARFDCRRWRDLLLDIFNVVVLAPDVVEHLVRELASVRHKAGDIVAPEDKCRVRANKRRILCKAGYASDTIGITNSLEGRTVPLDTLEVFEVIDDLDRAVLVERDALLVKTAVEGRKRSDHAAEEEL